MLLQPLTSNINGGDLNPRSEDLYGGDANESKDNSSLRIFTYDVLAPFANKPLEKVSKNTQYVFKCCMTHDEACNPPPRGEIHLQGIPVSLINMLTKDNLKSIADALKVKCTQRMSIAHIRKDIIDKLPYVTGWNLVFAHKSIKLLKPRAGKKAPCRSGKPAPPPFEAFHPPPLQTMASPEESCFPPPPASKELIEKIVNGWVNDIRMEMIEEAGCKVCGLLTSQKDLTKVEDIKGKVDFMLLERPNIEDEPLVTRKERKKDTDPVEPLPGPVLDPDCNSICDLCLTSLKKHKVPKNALANGLWVGKVPEELTCLTFAEKLLVSRVRTNHFVVRVSSGLSKMTGNAIAVSIPTAEVYKVLPVPREKFDDVLAFIYTAPVKPLEEQLKKVPLLVSHKRVYRALTWLKLNHVQYADLEISKENMETYKDNELPVGVSFEKTDPSDGNKKAESTAVHDCEEEEGVTSGPLPFVVHGLTGEELPDMSVDALKLAAAAHLKTYVKYNPADIIPDLKGKGTRNVNRKAPVLTVGRAKQPESLFNNPTLYTQMFPWLFPYGLGGMGMTSASDNIWKHSRLMYHDKRFQFEGLFPLLLNNHDQIRQATTGGFLMTNRKNFGKVVDRVLNLDPQVLTELARKINNKEQVGPKTDEERTCFDIINDMDHVAYDVNGSATSKKHMRNEIWATIAYLGAPTWFITFVPADKRVPYAFT